MIQDILALSAFGLAATAFGALVYTLKLMAALRSQNSNLSKKLSNFRAEHLKLTSEVEALEDHVRVSEDLRQGLQAKLEGSAQRVEELSRAIEDQKKSFLFQETAWLKDRKDLEDSLQVKKEDVIKATEKIKDLESRLESRIGAMEIPNNARPSTLVQTSKTKQKSLGGSAYTSHNSKDFSRDQLKDNRLPLSQTPHQFNAAEGSRRGLTLSSKSNSFLSQSSSKENTSFEKPDSRGQTESWGKKSSTEKPELQGKSAPLEKDHYSSHPDSLRVNQLNLMVRTLQGRKSMLEERNQNWEVALRYLSEYVLRNKGEKPVPSEIGPLVALALQAINKSLMMNEMFSTDLDDLDDLSKLSDLIHDDHGSVDPFKREHPAP